MCSARSGSTKALGTTNLLLRAASEALRRPKSTPSVSGTATPLTKGLFGVRSSSNISDHSQSPPTSPRPRSSRSGSPQPLFGMTPMGEQKPEFSATVELIRAEHFSAARACIQDPDLRRELEEEIDRDCEWLRSFLFAAKVCYHPNRRVRSLFDYCSVILCVLDRLSTRFHLDLGITSLGLEREWHASS